MGRGAVLLAVLGVAGCATLAGGRADIDAHLERELPSMRATLGTAGRQSVVLRYAVDAWDGHWTDELVVTPERFVEHRVRDDGEQYTFGEDRVGAFLRVGADGPWQEADPTWASEARTRHALFAAQFLAPSRGDTAELVGRFRSTWEYAYRPAGGATITFDVARATGVPRGYDVVDGFGRLFTCEDLAWRRVAGQSVPASADCWGSNGTHAFGGDTGNVARWQRYTLADARLLGAELPAFARVDDVRAAGRLATAVQTYPLAGTGRSAVIPAFVGDARAPSQLIVDTGAFWTILDEDAALEAGVVPTGETPYYNEPPWLPQGEYTLGVADHVRVAGTVLVGVRVLMLSGLRNVLGGADGLLGENVLSQMVVDFDTPHGALRFYPEGSFVPAHDAFRYQFDHGYGARVPASVVGLPSGDMILDTGASTAMVVSAPGVAAVYPRRHGMDAPFGLNDSSLSPDYWTTIDGAHLGPFELPSMLVVARDRDQDEVGGVGLVGMGLLRMFRATFDFRHGEVYLTPGDAYSALARSGLQVVDAGGAGARISSVSLRSPAHEALLREGDRIVAIDDVATHDEDEVRHALAVHRGARTELRLVRRGRELHVPIALDPLGTDCTGPGDRMCPADGLLYASLER